MLKWIKDNDRRLFFRFFYLRKPPWDTGITPPELEEFIASHPPGRALDLGCGTGTNAINLAKRGWEVTGVDFVPSAIRQAQKKARRAGVVISFHVGDVSDPPFYQGQYDLIYDIGCFHSLDVSFRPRYRDLVARHLSPGGTYMLYGYVKDMGSSITDTDLEGFQSLLNLKHREDGAGRKDRPSAWFWFEPKSEQG